MKTVVDPIRLVSSSRAFTRWVAGLGGAVALTSGVAAAQPAPLAPIAPLAPLALEEPRAGAPAVPKLAWRPEWHRPSALDYAATGVFLVGAGIEPFLPSGSKDRKWSGGILFDNAVRDVMVLHDASDRAGIGNFSNVLLTALAAYPFVVDVGLTAWLGRGSPDVAWNMAMIDAEAFGFTALMTGFIKRAVDRERPNGTECRKNPGYDPGCGSGDQHYSFLSGHTSISFTGAGLVCMHHANLALLGREGDVLSCVSALTTAALTGVSRIAADKHYVSDVLAGAGLGLVSGMLLPYVFYYRSRSGAPLPVVGGGVIAPIAGPQCSAWRIRARSRPRR